jgi:FlaA1/EpsC-like NDP-sugar epimerase
VFSPVYVPIVFTLLRLGEKLEESLWEDGAEIQDTPHPEVLKVTERHSVDAEHLGRAVESLANAAIQGDRARMELGLRQLIPSFSPAVTNLPSPRAH